MTQVRQAMLLLCAAAWIAVVSAAGGCGSNNDTGGPDAGQSRRDRTPSATPKRGLFGGGDDGGIPAPCPGTGGLDCYVPAGCTTSVSGTVYDPAGRNPLYNVVVFVPNDPYGTLPPITPGTHSCNTCDVSIGELRRRDDDRLARATSPSRASRRPRTCRSWCRPASGVARCSFRVWPPARTPRSTAANSRLPKNHNEGDLPQMALLTGGCDDLGCFMKSMGIDDGEYTAPHGGGRLDVYQGVGVGGAPERREALDGRGGQLHRARAALSGPAGSRSNITTS